MLRAQCDRAAIMSSAIRKAKDFALLSAAGLSLALKAFERPQHLVRHWSYFDGPQRLARLPSIG